MIRPRSSAGVALVLLVLAVLAVLGVVSLYRWLAAPVPGHDFLYVVMGPGFERYTERGEPRTRVSNEKSYYHETDFPVREGRVVPPFPKGCTFYRYDVGTGHAVVVTNPTSLKLDPRATSPDGFELYVEPFGHAWSNYSRPLEASLRKTGTSHSTKVDLGLQLGDRLRFGFIGWIEK